MQARLRKGYAATALAAVSVVLLIVSMTAPALSTSADFSIYNSDWNGTSDLAIMTYELGKFVPTFRVESSGTEIDVAQVALDSVELDPRTSALVIIGPTKEFTDSEGAILEDYVREGGRLLLADDFGTGNDLLEAMNSTSRFSRDLVMDLAYEKQPEFTVLFDLRADPLTRNVSTLLLNYPSSLTVNPATTEAIAYSSIASWLDTNGNRLQEWGEPRGPFPMLAREEMGNGTIILLSDPSVLINGMKGYGDNAQFASNLIDEVCRDRTSIMFDESHRDFFDPISVTMQFSGQLSTNAKVVLVIVGLVLTLWLATDLVDMAVAWLVRRARRALVTIMTAMRLGFLFRRAEEKTAPMTAEQLVEELTKAHPDWRPGLMRYLIKESERHSGAPEK